MPRLFRSSLMPRVAAALWISIQAAGQMPQSVMLPENAAKKVSDHVYVIMGFPNIGIVVGNKATLVVDTGLGPRNGAIIAKEVVKLAKGPGIYLTTTHFHPEHAAGEGGFPARTILIRDAVQQQEMERSGQQMINMFSGFSAQNKELLAGVIQRKPDIIFDRELKVDLGGLTARLLWYGAGHTKGDELIYVEEDGVLLSGDIVENKTVPALFGDDSTVKGWISLLEKLEELKPRFIVPDHGELGDGSLLPKELAFLKDAQARALELKKQGLSADDAGKMMIAEFKQKYPDWPNLNGLAGVAKKVYVEGQ